MTKIKAKRYRQTKGCNAPFGLSVSVHIASPYYRQTETDRPIKLTVETMLAKLVFFTGAVPNVNAVVYWYNGSTFSSANTIPVNLSGITTPEAYREAVIDAILAYAVANSISLVEEDILIPYSSITPVNPDWNSSSGLSQILNKPAQQAHVGDAATNAATDAPTDLNVLTTLVGTLTGEVNNSNAKYNDLASKYNDLATKFNTLLDNLEAYTALASS